MLNFCIMSVLRFFNACRFRMYNRKGNSTGKTRFYSYVSYRTHFFGLLVVDPMLNWWGICFLFKISHFFISIIYAFLLWSLLTNIFLAERIYRYKSRHKSTDVITIFSMATLWYLLYLKMKNPFEITSG